MDATGHCLCGAVSYTADDVETELHVCHCDMCRRWSGGPAFAANVGKVAFENEHLIKRFESSDWAERGFCTQCGTNLFYRLKESDQYILCMGSFDDQTRFKLSGEIFVDSKPAAYELSGDHPRLTGQEFMASLQPDDA